MVKNTQTYKWDWIGLDGLDGWKSPGGRRYRAPYGANKRSAKVQILDCIIGRYDVLHVSR